MENTNRQNNSVLVLVFIFLITPFLSLVGIRDLVGSTIYQAWQIASLAIFLLMFFTQCANITFSLEIALFAIYQFIIFVITTVNHGFSPGILVVIAASILIFVLMQTDYYYEIISALCIIITISLIINFPIMMQRIDFIDPEFFIGGKNALGIFLIPGIFLLLINAHEKNQKVSYSSLLIIAFSFITVLIGSSGTGIIVTVCALILLLISMKFKPKKMIFVGIILALYALFLIFSDDFFLTNAWLSFTDMLGKDSTLTARTSIWETAIEVIKRNWLFGAGRGVRISFINEWGERQIFHEAHNFILEILMEGGIVSLLLYGTVFGRTVVGLDMDKTKHKFIFIALCILLINGLTESTVNGFLVTVILSIACRYASEARESKNKQWTSDLEN